MDLVPGFRVNYLKLKRNLRVSAVSDYRLANLNPIAIVGFDDTAVVSVVPLAGFVPAFVLTFVEGRPLRSNRYGIPF